MEHMGNGTGDVSFLFVEKVWGHMSWGVMVNMTFITVDSYR